MIGPAYRPMYLAEPAQQHLHRDRHEQHAHEPLHRDQPALAEEAAHDAREVEDDARRQPGERDGQQPLGPTAGLAAGEQQHRRERRRSCRVRHGQRHDERFLFHFLAKVEVGGREDHPERDQQQDDAARDGQRLGGHAQQPQQAAPEEQERDEQGERDEQLPHDDVAMPRGRDAAQRREEQRHVAERVHHEEQQHRRREHRHGGIMPRLAAGALRQGSGLVGSVSGGCRHPSRLAVLLSC